MSVNRSRIDRRLILFFGNSTNYRIRGRKSPVAQTSRVQEDRQFIETCLALDLLNETESKTLGDSIGRDGRGVAQTALQRGFLTPVDVDIVHSIQFPLEVIPGYRILNLVGRGGMGVVYRAKQLDLDRIVALKIILISNVKDSTIAARFEREAKALARLQHPNIVQALNFGKCEGRYYLSMEYVPGVTCEQAVRDRGLMTPDQAWSIARQVASGLLHASSQNLIHRDIKPANLILLPPPEGSSTNAEVVKITDFGLALLAEQGEDALRLTTGDKVMGSPAYMSLEQFGGRKVDFRTDMFSIGATIWHLLFGKPPHQGRSVPALFQQKSEPFVFDPAKLPVQLPDDQMGLLVGLLDPNPDLRPQSYEQLIDAIDALNLSTAAQSTAAQSTAAQSTASRSTASRSSDPQSDSGSSASTRDLISQQPTLTHITPQAGNRIETEGGEELVGGAMTQTIELAGSGTAPSVKSFGSARLKWGAACLLGVAVIAAFSFVGIAKPQRGPRTFTRVVGNTPLFDGVTLSGWDVGGSMSGAWKTVEDPDSSTAIACTTRRGAMTRRIPATPHPRISLFVWLQKGGGPVDVDFAFDMSSVDDTRGCLRLSGESTQLGTKTSDFGELDVAVETKSLPTVYDRFQVIHFERQPRDWYVFLEEQFIGSLPIEQIGDGDSLRLVVHSGDLDGEGPSAYFADVQLYELGRSTVAAVPEGSADE
jgi:serine/threonine protein kinase